MTPLVDISDVDVSGATGYGKKRTRKPKAARKGKGSVGRVDARLVACRECGAEPGKPCRLSRERKGTTDRTAVHVERLEDARRLRPAPPAYDGLDAIRAELQAVAWADLSELLTAALERNWGKHPYAQYFKQSFLRHVAFARDCASPVYRASAEELSELPEPWKGAKMKPATVARYTTALIDAGFIERVRGGFYNLRVFQ